MLPYPKYKCIRTPLPLMLERYLEEDEAKTLEMKLLTLSMYEDVYYLVNDLRRADGLLKASSPLLRRTFDRELNDLEREVSLFVNDMSKVLGGSLDVSPKREDLRKVRDELRKVRSEVSELLAEIQREVELATSTLSEVLIRMPDAGVETRFLAARLNEAPAKLSYMPGNYLEILVDLMRSLLPPYDGDVTPIAEKLDEVSELLREVGNDFADKEVATRIKDIMEILSYLRLLLGKYRQLAPGIKRYLDELRSSSVVFPRGGE